MSIEKILVIDDDRLLRDFLCDHLIEKKFKVTSAESGIEALSILEKETFDLVLSDLHLPGITGVDIVKKVKEVHPATLVVIAIAPGTVQNSAEAIQAGAFLTLSKPLSEDTLEAIIAKAREQIRLLEENNYLRHQVFSRGSHSKSEFICKSPAMKQILHDVQQIAASNASVLISGESGTGKEVIANMLHHYSNRSHKPFIRVNCAAMPETLMDSEFFGHEKGAFSGAHAKRLGRFELAHEGTLLLDEVTEIPIALQAKLLRAVQEQEFERLGGSKSVKVDVRLISTSNRDIESAVANKILREDLYYRLNVIPIILPSLRDRREDIIPLTEYFLQKISSDNKRPKKELTQEVRKFLLDYHWPGNVRELANLIERAVVIDNSAYFTVDHLYLHSMGIKARSNYNSILTLKEMERIWIQEALESNENDITKAAGSLGISEKELLKKIKN